VGLIAESSEKEDGSAGSLLALYVLVNFSPLHKYYGKEYNQYSYV
jgi:hypothetical protein